MELYDFLRGIRANNNREWLTAHRDEYDLLRNRWLSQVEELIGYMSEWEPAIASQTAKSAAYRFARDTRFSRDKSPYKTYFSALLSPWGRKTERAAYYLHMGPANPDGDPATTGSGVYGGIWCPSSPILKKLRQAIVDNIEEFDEICSDPELQSHFPGWFGDRLKTIPQGWDRNHPQADLLRLKEYGRFSPMDESVFARPDWPRIASDRMRILKPLVDFLNYSIDEEL